MALPLWLGSSVLLAADPVIGWVTTNGDAGFVPGTAATSSPVTTDADGDTVVGHFPAVTLGVGETLELSGTVSVTGVVGALPGSQLRWGLFRSPGMPASGHGSGYVGVFASADGDLRTADGSAANPFSSAASTSVATGSDPQGDGPRFGVPLRFELTLTRLDADRLSATGRLRDGGALDLRWPATTIPAQPADCSYNAVGVLLGGTLDATEAGFSDISVSALESPPGTGDPGAPPGDRLLAIDFNRNDALGSPSQSCFRVIAGSADPGVNSASYTKKIGPYQVTVSQQGSSPFEFRGGNADPGRAIPGGDVSISFLVADFIASREGALRIAIASLPAGRYFFRSRHLDPTTGADLGFAQGSSPTTPATLEARVGGVPMGSVQPTALGSAGLDTTFIDDADVPTLGFEVLHDGHSPLVLDLVATEPGGSDTFVLLNGFELYELPAP